MIAKYEIKLIAREPVNGYNTGDYVTIKNEIFNRENGVAFIPIDRRFDIVYTRQYTGFKDLNGEGKEIYEEDSFEGDHGIGVVKMINGCWKVCLDDYDVLLCEYLRNDPTRETKGNINQNQ